MCVWIIVYMCLCVCVVVETDRRRGGGVRRAGRGEKESVDVTYIIHILSQNRHQIDSFFNFSR